MLLEIKTKKSFFKTYDIKSTHAKEYIMLKIIVNHAHISTTSLRHIANGMLLSVTVGAEECDWH